MWGGRDSNPLSVSPVRRVYTRRIYSPLPLPPHSGESGTRTHDLLNANQTLSPNWATTPKIDSNCLSILSLSPPRYKSRPGEVQRLHHGYTHRVWALATSIQVPDLTTDWFVIPPRRERKTGLEPVTFSLEGWRSGQLSYFRIFIQVAAPARLELATLWLALIKRFELLIDIGPQINLLPTAFTALAI